MHNEPILRRNAAPLIHPRNQSIHTDAMNFHYSTTEQKTDAYALHCHPFYEIFYFVSGEVSYLVEGKPYVPRPGSILLIAPHVFHGVRIDSDRPYSRFALHFDARLLTLENRTLLLSPFHTEDGPKDIYYPHADEYEMPNYFQQLMACGTMSEDMRDLTLKIRLEALLSQLLTMSRSSEASSIRPAPSAKSIAMIIEYLNEHIAEHLTLDDISSRFFLSKHHLNKVFRKATGTTVGNYVIHKRVILAQQLLLQGQTAGFASASAGFRDYSVFYRAYKKIFGHAPSEGRSPLGLR